jgi:flagellar biosynthesis/type III secretory pathway protein FliH
MANTFNQMLYSKPLKDHASGHDKNQRFSYDDVDAAKQIAFAQGVEIGEKQKSESIEAMILGVLEKVESGILVLLEDLDKDTTLFCELLISALKKIAPALEYHISKDNILIMIKEHLAPIRDQRVMKIIVHPDLVDPLLVRITEKSNLNERVKIFGDDTLGKWDCHMVWVSGEIRRSFDEIVEKILAAIEQQLHEK